MENIFFERLHGSYNAIETTSYKHMCICLPPSLFRAREPNGLRFSPMQIALAGVRESANRADKGRAVKRARPSKKV